MSQTTKYILAATTFLTVPAFAFAQAVATAPESSINWTPIVTAIVGGVFSVIGIVATSLINSRMKDKQAADVLDKAVANSLGAVQNAVTNQLQSHPLETAIPGISAPVAKGVQYVIDHAGDEATRLGVTPEAIADKVEAKMGLAQIPAPPASPPATVTPPVTPVVQP